MTEQDNLMPTEAEQVPAETRAERPVEQLQSAGQQAPVGGQSAPVELSVPQASVEERVPVEPSLQAPPNEVAPTLAEQAVVAAAPVVSDKIAAQNNCRHEYVKIYQRRLKGLDRRLVATRAYLPVGFKIGDFGHLSEGSFCFCTKCRKRLFPKRSQGEKEQARLERQQAKNAGVAAAFAARSLMSDDDSDDSILSGTDDIGVEDDDGVVVFDESVDEDKMTVEVPVDELEVESVDVEDIKAEGVKLVQEDGFEESCELIEDVDA